MSLPRVVALGGPPGSGKTTAARGLSDRLGLELVSAGGRFRAEAAARGMDLAAFSEFAESHPEVDRSLDDGLVAEARPGRVIEARLTGPLCRRRGVPVFWLAVVARPEVRAERLARRDHQPLAAARAAMVAREASEHRRYLALYGVDLDREAADLTVDSSELAPEAVVDRLARYLEEARGR